LSIELTSTTLQNQFENLIATEDKLLMQEFLNHQNISDVADLIYDNPDYETQIIGHLSLHRASSVFKILDTSAQKRIIKDLPPFKATELLNELPLDDRVAFLEDLPNAYLRDLIKSLGAEERKETLEALGYNEGSVGRIMTPDYVYVNKNNTFAEVIDIVRKYGKSSETIDVIYVIDDNGVLLDDFRIKEVILAHPSKTVSELMDGRYITLKVTDPQQDAHEVFKMNNRVALPVTDENNILMGIVTIDDILWVAEEAFTEDMQKIGGTEALDEPYTEIPLLKLYKKRIIWLIILFFGELITIFAMQQFQAQIAKVVLLATFIPLIISSGGNSGSQASTLIIQAIALGEVTINDWWKIISREIVSGLLLGGTLAIFGAGVVTTWHAIHPQTFGPQYGLIAAAISLSLLGVVLWGTLIGSTLPLILKKLGADPAASSTPFVATLVDVTGLLIYFSMAFLFLKGTLL
jgi:magnesium transporter